MKEGDRVEGGVRVQKQAVKGNDSHGGQRAVCEGDGASRGRQGIVEVKLISSSCLSVYPHGTTRLPLDGVS